MADSKRKHKKSGKKTSKHRQQRESGGGGGGADGADACSDHDLVMCQGQIRLVPLPHAIPQALVIAAAICLAANAVRDEKKAAGTTRALEVMPLPTRPDLKWATKPAVLVTTTFTAACAACVAAFLPDAERARVIPTRLDQATGLELFERAAVHEQEQWREVIDAITAAKDNLPLTAAHKRALGLASGGGGPSVQRRVVTYRRPIVHHRPLRLDPATSGFSASECLAWAMLDEMLGQEIHALYDEHSETAVRFARVAFADNTRVLFHLRSTVMLVPRLLEFQAPVVED